MENDIDLLTDYVHKPTGPVGYFIDTTPTKPWVRASKSIEGSTFEEDCPTKPVSTTDNLLASPTVKWILIGVGVVILIVVIFGIFGSVQKTNAPTQQQLQKLTDSSRYLHSSGPPQEPISAVSFSAPPTLSLPIVDPSSILGGQAIEPQTQTSVAIRNPAIVPGENEPSARDR